jgi:FAD/FMN-containing dehydrogenase
MSLSNGTSPSPTPLTPYDVETLRTRLHGELLLPEDEGYEAARVIWNGSVQQRPALIVRPLFELDVITAVRFAREHGLPLAVRSGAHSFPGFSSVEGGVVVDFSLMKALDIDPVRRVARAQPGLTWGEYAQAANEYGLATTSGDVATVGIGGLTLGGGIGWMVRKYGLTIDHLIAVELVTASGRLLRASAEENPDLFWALRGGGGNFGIVTAFEFRLEQAGTLLGGAVIYSAEDLAEGTRILRAAIDYADAAPDELTVMIMFMPAPPLPFIPADRVGEFTVAVGLLYAGDLAEGERVVAPLRSLATPIADIVGPMPYPAIFALGAEAEAKGMHHEVRSLFTSSLDDATLTTILDHARRGPTTYPRGQIRILGGAMARIPAAETAFAQRHQRFMVSIFGSADDADGRAHYLPWFQAFWRELQPLAEGVYVNFLSDEGKARIRSAYSDATLARLAAVKAQYDPDNVFRRNQNIEPVQQPSREERAA